ncbi:MAG: hypothetical protein JOY84_05800 [Curvibacter sp.]|nr:hypothetical protein [Curvibacter sp.]
MSIDLTVCHLTSKNAATACTLLDLNSFSQPEDAPSSVQASTTTFKEILAKIWQRHLKKKSHPNQN